MCRRKNVRLQFAVAKNVYITQYHLPINLRGFTLGNGCNFLIILCTPGTILRKFCRIEGDIELNSGVPFGRHAPKPGRSWATLVMLDNLEYNGAS
ncbi:hypothetical protein M514_12282 [Trichuris suis]|uniref:Uncharacterized protein n=1 Tax=Trichuris suis TaxID=68888 RepID=A0A085N698_9BILA|nr:hypothetical protein M513_12282 [Trichuris suis]KFD64994.1 hypothetical protein M514_12282 [Trichuris suis]